MTSDAKNQGELIVLLYTIFVNFLRWSIGFYLMRPNQTKTEMTQLYSAKVEPIDTRDRNQSIKSKIISTNLLISQVEYENTSNVLNLDSTIDSKGDLNNLRNIQRATLVISNLMIRLLQQIMLLLVYGRKC